MVVQVRDQNTNNFICEIVSRVSFFCKHIYHRPCHRSLSLSTTQLSISLAFVCLYTFYIFRHVVRNRKDPFSYFKILENPTFSQKQCFFSKKKCDELYVTIEIVHILYQTQHVLHIFTCKYF
jgi:hypothetical protein